MSELTTIPGVGNITAEKLQSAGFDNIDAVAEAAVELLVQLTGFYEARAAAIRDAARELAHSAPQLELVPGGAEEQEPKAKKAKAKAKKKAKKAKAKKAKVKAAKKSAGKKSKKAQKGGKKAKKSKSGGKKDSKKKGKKSKKK